MLNSHPPSSSYGGWLLAMGEGRQKSATKPSSISKWHGIWICCLKAEAGGTRQIGAPSGRSQTRDKNLDEDWSGSYLIVGARGTRDFCGMSNNALGILDETATKSVKACKATGGCS